MWRPVAFKILCLFSIALLVVLGNNKADITLSQSPNCLGSTCNYLPLIIRPVPIVVVSTSLYNASTGSKDFFLLVAAEIRNESNVSFGDVILRARVYSSGQLIREVQQKAIIPATLPGQLNIYRFDPSVFGAFNPQNYPTTVDVLTMTVDTSERFRNLKIESVATSGLVTEPGRPGTTVTVTVRNNHAQTLYNVQVMVWSFATDLSNDNYILCNYGRCSGNSSVPAMSPGQVYTITLNWRDMSLGNAVVPPNADQCRSSRHYFTLIHTSCICHESSDPSSAPTASPSRPSRHSQTPPPPHLLRPGF